ncbi:MAG: hypothetical protein H7338_02225 [Candidatus Sericytochromatia bacterium]|nr:hypothetical protein [Candidatus Sericytochromatia bacterium]
MKDAVRYAGASSYGPLESVAKKKSDPATIVPDVTTASPEIGGANTYSSTGTLPPSGESRRTSAKDFVPNQQQVKSAKETRPPIFVMQTILKALTQWNAGMFDATQVSQDLNTLHKRAEAAGPGYGKGDCIVCIEHQFEPMTHEDAKETPREAHIAPMQPMVFPQAKPGSFAVELAHNYASDSATFAGDLPAATKKNLDALIKDQAKSGKTLTVTLHSSGIGHGPELAVYGSDKVKRDMESRRFVSAEVTVKDGSFELSVASGVDPVKSQWTGPNIKKEGLAVVNRLIKNPTTKALLTGTVNGNSVTLSANDLLSATRAWSGSKQIARYMTDHGGKAEMPKSITLGRMEGKTWTPILDAGGKEITVSAADMETLLANQAVTAKPSGNATTKVALPTESTGASVKEITAVLADGPKKLNYASVSTDGKAASHAPDLSEEMQAEGKPDPAVDDVVKAMVSQDNGAAVQQSANASDQGMDSVQAWLKEEVGPKAEPSMTVIKDAFAEYMKTKDANAARKFDGLMAAMTHAPAESIKFAKALTEQVRVNARLHEIVGKTPTNLSPPVSNLTPGLTLKQPEPETVVRTLNDTYV